MSHACFQCPKWIMPKEIFWSTTEANTILPFFTVFQNKIVPCWNLSISWSKFTFSYEIYSYSLIITTKDLACSWPRSVFLCFIPSWHPWRQRSLTGKLEVLHNDDWFHLYPEKHDEILSIFTLNIGYTIVVWS